MAPQLAKKIPTKVNIRLVNILNRYDIKELKLLGMLLSENEYDWTGQNGN